MHDPNTIAFEIKYPWRDRNPDGTKYRRAFITIWHHDPEKDGSDDSCGWSYPRLTKAQGERIKGLAWCEAYGPRIFTTRRMKVNNDAVEVETLARAGLLLVADVLRVRLSWEEASRLASRLCHAPGNNIRSSFCLLPGWHTNDPKDAVEASAYWKQEHAEGLFHNLARHVLDYRRHWWQHPRWHVWHWCLTVHPYRTLCRRLWTRCAKCGKPFKRRESPISNQWDGGPAGLFRGEENVYHQGCLPAFTAAETTNTAPNE